MQLNPMLPALAITLVTNAAAGTLTPEQEVELVYQTASVLPAGPVQSVEFGYQDVSGVETFAVTLSGMGANGLTIWIVEDFYFEDLDEGGQPTLLTRTQITETLIDASNSRTQFHYDFTPFDGTFPTSADGSLMDGELFGFQVDRNWNQGYYDGTQSLHLAISSGAYGIEDLEQLGSLVSTNVVYAIQKKDADLDWTVLPGEPTQSLADHLAALDDIQPQHSYLVLGGFWDCMKDCMSPIGLAKRVTYVSLMGIGIGACVFGAVVSGGTVFVPCALAMHAVSKGIGHGISGFGFFSCAIHCMTK